MKNESPLLADAQDKTLEGLLILMGLFIPLAFCTRMDDTFDLPKATLLYAGALTIFTRWLWRDHGIILRNISRTPLAWPLASCLLAFSAATVVSWDPWYSLWGQPREYAFGLLPSLAFAVVYLAASQAAGEGFNRRLAGWLILGGACAALYGILQYFDLELFSAIPRAAGGRVWSTFGNPLYLGAYLMMLVPLALGGWLEARGALASAAWLGLLLLFLAVIALTQSRSALAGCGASLLAFYWSWGKPSKSANPTPTKVLAIAATCLVAAGLFPGIRARLADLRHPQETTDAARLAGWAGGLGVTADHPWLGTGPDTFIFSFRGYKSPAYLSSTGNRTTQAHAHNDLIQFAATTGLIGLGCWLWLAAAAVYGGYRAVQDSPTEERALKAAFFSALAALAVQNQFNFSTVSTSLLAALLLGGLSARAVRPEASVPARAPAAVRIALCLLLWGGWWTTQLQQARADIHYKESLESGGPRGLARLEQAVRENSHSIEYRNTLSNRYRDLARAQAEPGLRRELLEKALEHGRLNVQFHPYNPDGHNNLGVAYMWLTQMLLENHQTDAKWEFAQAAALDPTFVDAWANLARVAHFLGEPDVEKQLWEEVLSLDPWNKDALTVIGQIKTQRRKQ